MKQFGRIIVAAVFVVLAFLGAFRLIDLINTPATACKPLFAAGTIVTDKLNGKPLIISVSTCDVIWVRDGQNQRFMIGTAEFTAP